MRTRKKRPFSRLGVFVLSIPLLAALSATSVIVDKIDQPKFRLAVFEASANPATPQKSLRLMTVSNATARGAVCNDGSPAKYYFRPGTEMAKDKWLIFFEGGGGCINESTCLERAAESPTLISSNGYRSSLTADGIFTIDAAKNPDFYNWNHVYMKYCSSDAWAGASTQTVNGSPWIFHGKAIVDAVIEDLQNPQIIRSATFDASTEVLLAGSSAGSEGLAHNLDDIAAVVPGATVKGLLDSNWKFIGDVKYADAPNSEGDRYEMRQLFQDWRQTVNDDTCAAAHPSDLGLCGMVAVAYPYLETPVYIFENQMDNLVMNNLGATSPFDTSEQVWFDTVYRPALLNSFQPVLQSQDGLFAPKKTFHIIATRPYYFNTAINGISFQQSLTNWYFGRSGQTQVIE